MKKTKYKVLITTAGIGERLGDITKYTNKSLVKLGQKPVISYIIDAYPKDTQFVIVTGYFGDQVRDLLKMVYPRKRFTFVEVDRYTGRGSSLGYSMLYAQKELQCPFIYHASDTVVTEKLPRPDRNWIGGHAGDGTSHYASFNVIDNRVEKMNEKGFLNPDFLHIGLVGVHDYDAFWKSLNDLYNENPNNGALGDIHVINRMIAGGTKFEVTPFTTWYDTGNVESLQKARREIADAHNILDKLRESIYLFDSFAVKFFFDEGMVKQRVTRAKMLKGLVPTVQAHTKNFFRYKKAEGELYSEVANPANFGSFLTWAQHKLWKNTREVPDAQFRDVCHDFYYKKSMKRIKEFLKSHALQDTEHIINDERVPTIEQLFKMIDFKWLCDTKQSYFHGDFILDNIIRTKKGFSLLDWRQNFGGLLRAGDMYYDLAKLNHNLTVNHGIVTSNLFTININDAIITCDILRKDNLVECQRVLFDFLKKEGYDARKVKLLTAIIWLNMSPLHHHPFDLFLFYYGKLHLLRAIHEIRQEKVTA